MPFTDWFETQWLVGVMTDSIQALLVWPSLLGWLQIIGATTGILGGYLIACNNHASKFGYLWFLVSNVAWTVFGFITGAVGLVVMQGFFFVTTMIGLKHWFPSVWRKIRLTPWHHKPRFHRRSTNEPTVAANDDVAVLDLVSRGRRAGSL